MNDYEDKIVQGIISERESAVGSLRQLANRLKLKARGDETNALFAGALTFAADVLHTGGDKTAVPDVSGELVTKYTEVLACLYELTDRMYPSRKKSPLLTFLSHENYVRALELAIKEIQLMYPE